MAAVLTNNPKVSVLGEFGTNLKYFHSHEVDLKTHSIESDDNVAHIYNGIRKSETTLKILVNLEILIQKVNCYSRQRGPF